MAKRAWSVLLRRRWLIAALVALAILGLALVGYSASRLLRRPPPPPRQTDVSLIAGWMTVPYVSRTFGVPPPELYRALGLPPEDHDRSSLNDLATASGRTSDEVVAIVKQTVLDFQATHPDRGRPPPSDPTPLPSPTGNP